MSNSKYGQQMVEMVLGVILVVVGLAMAGPLNTTITNMTTGANATAQGAAATAMWGIVPILFGVMLFAIPLAQVLNARKG